MLSLVYIIMLRKIIIIYIRLKLVGCSYFSFSVELNTALDETTHLLSFTHIIFKTSHSIYFDVCEVYCY